MISKEVLPICKLSYSGGFGSVVFSPIWGFPSKSFMCLVAITLFPVVLAITSCQLAHQILSLFAEDGCLLDSFGVHAFHLLHECSTMNYVRCFVGVHKEALSPQ